MNHWQIAIALAALFNFAVGGTGLFRKGATLDGRLVSVLVVCLGIVYAIVASDVTRYAPVLWAGIAGKLAVIALVLPAVRDGKAPKGAWYAVLGDGIFVGVFLVLLVAPLLS